jgi:hypothetical protein
MRSVEQSTAVRIRTERALIAAVQRLRRSSPGSLLQKKLLW